MPKKNIHQKAKKHIDKKLRRRLRIYLLISFILLCVVVYEVVSGLTSIFFAITGIVIGTLIGIVVARMFRLSWNHNAKQIISKMDMFGGSILALYIIFAIFRSRIIGHFIQGSAVGAISLSVADGVMIGRVLGTRGKIIKILKEQKVF